MSYWQMDDGFLGHHKTRRALRKGAEALQMWLALRTYVAVNTTNGTIPDEDIDDLANAPKSARKWLDVLVGCGEPLPSGARGPGLVDPLENGVWALHNYDRHGLSAAEVERRKEAARERKRKWSKNRSGTQPERRSEHVPDASENGYQERGSDEPPLPLPLPLREEEEIPPTPSEPQPQRVKPVDAFTASLTGNRTQDNPGVIAVFEAWKLAHGFTGSKFRSPADSRADVLFEAVNTNGIEACLRVIEASKVDGMVTGKADERGQEHRSIEYIFKPATFDRLLRQAEKARAEKPIGAAESVRRARLL